MRGVWRYRHAPQFQLIRGQRPGGRVVPESDPEHRPLVVGCETDAPRGELDVRKP